MRRTTVPLTSAVLVTLLSPLSAQQPVSPSEYWRPTKLLPNDGAPGDLFGHRAAISGGTVVVGAIFDADNGPESGSAYLFDVATGQQLAKLLPSDGAAQDNFGVALAIDATHVVAGSPRDDDNGDRSGSAYLFDVATGLETAKLLANDGAPLDYFGTAVGISGDTVVVSAPSDDDFGSSSGSAYLFDVATGQQLFKLLPSDGAASDGFGHDVAISGDTVVVSASGDDDDGHDSGSVYLFDATTGQQLAKLRPSDGAAYRHFGHTVAIHGTTVLIGTWTERGDAYLFDATTGQQLRKLVPNAFATTVGLDGSTAILGDPKDKVMGTKSGAAYLFDLATGEPFARLITTDGRWKDYFAIAVGISGDVAIVGASHEDDNGPDSGSVYLFRR